MPPQDILMETFTYNPSYEMYSILDDKDLALYYFLSNREFDSLDSQYLLYKLNMFNDVDEIVKKACVEDRLSIVEDLLYESTEAIVYPYFINAEYYHLLPENYKSYHYAVKRNDIDLVDEYSCTDVRDFKDLFTEETDIRIIRSIYNNCSNQVQNLLSIYANLGVVDIIVELVELKPTKKDLHEILHDKKNRESLINIIQNGLLDIANELYNENSDDKTMTALTINLASRCDIEAIKYIPFLSKLSLYTVTNYALDSITIVKSLIDNNVPCVYILTEAVKNNKIDIVKYIVELKGDVSEINLITALELEHNDIALFLLDHYIEEDLSTILKTLIKTCNVMVMEDMVDRGIDRLYLDICMAASTILIVREEVPMTRYNFITSLIVAERLDIAFHIANTDELNMVVEAALDQDDYEIFCSCAEFIYDWTYLVEKIMLLPLQYLEMIIDEDIDWYSYNIHVSKIPYMIEKNKIDVEYVINNNNIRNKKELLDMALYRKYEF